MIWGLLVWFIIFICGFLLSIVPMGVFVGVPIMSWSVAVYVLYYGLGKGKWAFWQDW